MLNTGSALDLVDALYLTSILADQPRSIDRYIDYFGGGAGASVNPGPGFACLKPSETEEVW